MKRLILCFWFPVLLLTGRTWMVKNGPYAQR